VAGGPADDHPRFVAGEPVSALDDLGIVRYLCPPVAVMHLGRIVEQGSVAHVSADPRHRGARSLIEASPRVAADATPSGPGCEPPTRREPSGWHRQD
jgi:ABC-type dipeptide/oligopeptide/nickel transport system ATPase component